MAVKGGARCTRTRARGKSEAEGVGRVGACEGEGRQDGRYYLLADPSPVEAHNFSTVVPHTGSARSSPQPLTVDNLPYSQHLRGDTYEGAGHRRRIKAEDVGHKVMYKGTGRGVMYKDGGTGLHRRNKAKEVWPGTCEMAKTRNVRHIMMEGKMYKDEGAGRSNKYKDKGEGRGDMYKDVGGGHSDKYEDEGTGVAICTRTSAWGINAGRRRRRLLGESRRSRMRPPARAVTRRGSRRSTGTRCGQGQV